MNLGLRANKTEFPALFGTTHFSFTWYNCDELGDGTEALPLHLHHLLTRREKPPEVSTVKMPLFKQLEQQKVYYLVTYLFQKTLQWS